MKHRLDVSPWVWARAADNIDHAVFRDAAELVTESGSDVYPTVCGAAIRSAAVGERPGIPCVGCRTVLGALAGIR